MLSFLVLSAEPDYSHGVCDIVRRSGKSACPRVRDHRRRAKAPRVTFERLNNIELGPSIRW